MILKMIEFSITCNVSLQNTSDTIIIKRVTLVYLLKWYISPIDACNVSLR